MNKRYLKFPFIIGVIVSAIFILYILINSTLNFITFSKNDKINHFNSISECKAFDEYIVSSKTSDDHINGIAFVDSYVRCLNYKGTKFTLYAYEFENADSAQRYYSNVEGYSANGKIDYHGTTGLFTSELTARYNNNVYRIETGGTQDYVVIMEYLNSVFTVNIKPGT